MNNKKYLKLFILFIYSYLTAELLKFFQVYRDSSSYIIDLPHPAADGADNEKKKTTLELTGRRDRCD